MTDRDTWARYDHGRTSNQPSQPVWIMLFDEPDAQAQRHLAGRIGGLIVDHHDLITVGDQGPGNGLPGHAKTHHQCRIHPDQPTPPRERKSA
jgi:hypothetical protein